MQWLVTSERTCEILTTTLFWVSGSVPGFAVDSVCDLWLKSLNRSVLGFFVCKMGTIFTYLKLIFIKHFATFLLKIPMAWT